MKRSYLIVLIFILSGVYHFSYFNVGLNLSDEGVLMEGIRLHRAGRLDFERFCHWSSMYGWFDGMTDLLGDNLLVIRATWALMRSATATIVFILSWELSGAFGFFALILTLLGSGPWHKSFVPFFTINSIWLTYYGLKTNKTLIWLGAAALSALAIAAHIYTGILNLMAFFFGIAGYCFISYRNDPALDWKRITRQLLVFTLTLIISTALLAPFLFATDWADWIERHQRIVRSDYLGFKEIGSLLIDENVQGRFEPRRLMRAFYPDLPVIVVVIALVIVVRSRRSRVDAGLLPIILVAYSITGYAKVLARFDLPHLFQNAVPTYVLLSWILKNFCMNARSKTQDRSRKLASAVGFYLILGLAAGAVIELLSTSDYYTGGIGIVNTERERKLDLDHAPIYLNRIDADRYESIVAFVQANVAPEECIFCAPFIPMFYFLCRRSSPTDVPLFDRIEDFYTVPEVSIIEDLKACSTKIVIIQDILTDGLEKNRFSLIAPQLHAFIETNYQPVAQWGDLQLRAAGAVP